MVKSAFAVVLSIAVASPALACPAGLLKSATWSITGTTKSDNGYPYWCEVTFSRSPTTNGVIPIVGSTCLVIEGGVPRTIKDGVSGGLKVNASCAMAGTLSLWEDQG